MTLFLEIVVLAHVITGFIGSQRIHNKNFAYRTVMTDITDATDIASYQNNKLHAC